MVTKKFFNLLFYKRTNLYDVKIPKVFSNPPLQQVLLPFLPLLETSFVVNFIFSTELNVFRYIRPFPLSSGPSRSLVDTSKPYETWRKMSNQFRNFYVSVYFYNR